MAERKQRPPTFAPRCNSLTQRPTKSIRETFYRIADNLKPLADALEKADADQAATPARCSTNISSSCKCTTCSAKATSAGWCERKPKRRPDSSDSAGVVAGRFPRPDDGSQPYESKHWRQTK